MAYAPLGRDLCLVDENRPSAIIVEKALDERFRAVDAPRLVAFDEASRLENERDAVRDDAGADDWACVFASAAAEDGRRRSIVLEHRCLTSAVEQARRHLALDDAFTVLSIAGVDDPVFFLELFLPLTTGGSIRFVDGLLFINRTYPHDHASVLFANPFAIERAFEDVRLPSGLRRLVLTQDIVSPSLVERLAGVGFGPALYGMLAQKETAGWTAGGAITVGAENVIAGAARDGDNVLKVLGPGLEPLPSGVDGELYVQGPTVGLELAGTHRGPVGTVGNGAIGPRRVPTGHVGHYLPDGRIRVTGYKPRRIEVNGRRIYVEAVESRLRELPNVREAAIVVNDGVTAFVTLHGAHVANGVNEVRRLVVESFPALPVECVVLPGRLPVGADGRVDHAALMANRSRATTPAPPLTATQETLLAIWKTVLNRELVGTKDNFFDLGGNSVDAYVACSHMSRSFAVYVTIVDFYSHPTIEEMARRIDGALASNGLDAGDRDVAAKAAAQAVPSPHG